MEQPVQRMAGFNRNKRNIMDVAMKTLLFLLLSCLTAHTETLQEMIDAAPAGSTVNVPAGIHQGTITIDKDLIVSGAGPGQTIIEGEGGDGNGWGLDVVVAIGEVQRPSVQLLNLTVRNGEQGISSIGSLVVSNCVIEGNWDSYGFGGGIATSIFSHDIILDTIIRSNIAGIGGGIYVGAGCTFFNCRIENNESRKGDGGGVHNWGAIIFESCTVVSNMASTSGGGISGDFTARSTTICGNRAFKPMETSDFDGKFTDLGRNNIGDCSAGIAIQLVDGSIQVSVSGTNTYEVQSSGPVGGVWGTIATNTAPFMFMDSGQSAVRFYRIQQRR